MFDRSGEGGGGNRGGDGEDGLEVESGEVRDGNPKRF